MSTVVTDTPTWLCMASKTRSAWRRERTASASTPSHRVMLPETRYFLRLSKLNWYFLHTKFLLASLTYFQVPLSSNFEPPMISETLSKIRHSLLYVRYLFAFSLHLMTDTDTRENWPMTEKKIMRGLSVSIFIISNFTEQRRRSS